jgi:hypothetical protein
MYLFRLELPPWGPSCHGSLSEVGQPIVDCRPATHDRVGPLSRALGLFRRCGAECIGALLCHRVEERVRARYPAAALGHLAALRPRLVVGECHFSHVEPPVDPHDAQALRACAGGGPLDCAGRARRGLAAVGQRLVSAGRYHPRPAATAGGPVGWRGEGPLGLAGAGRYCVVIGAAFRGRCGVLDAGRCELTPLPC